MNELTAQRLRELLSYDPETGSFTWLVTKGPRAKVGSVAGCLRTDGYMTIKLDGTHYKSHQLAWLHVHGHKPSGVIDHINGDRGDNRIANLRDVAFQTNTENRRSARKHSATGLIGVTPLRKRFVAQLMCNGKQKHIGVFDTPEQAHAAYLSEKRKRHSGATI